MLRSSLLAVLVLTLASGCSPDDSSTSDSGSAGVGGGTGGVGGGTGGVGGGTGGVGGGTGGAGGSTTPPGTHFAETATAWTLPAGSPNPYGYTVVSSSNWTTMDLDGDGKPDLVVHEGASEENRRWLLYKNTGSGFSETATAWTLPAGSPNPNGYTVVSSSSNWTTMDLDGDGKPDLVVHAGASEENRRWLLYKNTGSGFSETATAWTLPAGSPNPNGYTVVSSSNWTTMDLDGDGKPDLVVHAGASEENRRWLLYNNVP